MVFQSADAFDEMVRGEYARAMQSEMPADIANVMEIVATLSATGRNVNQNWMTPVPDPEDITGGKGNEKIPFGLLDVQNTAIRMRKFAHGFQVNEDDLDDDGLSLFAGKPAELVARSQRGVVKTILDFIANARAEVSFEGTTTQFQAANSHEVGTGDNLRVGTTADGTGETIAAVFLRGPLKPLIWYDRKRPQLQTNVGTPEANKAGIAQWWSKYRGAPAFGFWWDFVFVDVQGIPTTSEFKTILSDIKSAFRSFQLLDDSFVHEQTKFGADNLALILSPNLEDAVDQVIFQDKTIEAGVAVENNFQNFAKIIFFNGMDQD